MLLASSTRALMKQGLARRTWTSNFSTGSFLPVLSKLVILACSLYCGRFCLCGCRAAPPWYLLGAVLCCWFWVCRDCWPCCCCCCVWEGCCILGGGWALSAAFRAFPLIPAPADPSSSEDRLPSLAPFLVPCSSALLSRCAAWGECGLEEACFASGDDGALLASEVVNVLLVGWGEDCHGEEPIGWSGSLGKEL